MFPKIASTFLTALVLLSASAAQATDLSIFKDAIDIDGDFIEQITPDSQFRYQIQVLDSNEGVQGTDIVMTDNVPALLTIVSVETDFGTCQTNGQTVTCNLSGLADGASATILITVDLSASAALNEEVVNTAQVTASNEIQPSDNSATNSFLVSDETVVDPVESSGCSLRPARAHSRMWNSVRAALLGRF